MPTTLKAATPFGLAPTTDGHAGLLASAPDGSDTPYVAASGFVQVAVAPVVAPVGAQPTTVYCQADHKIYNYDLVLLSWHSTAALV